MATATQRTSESFDLVGARGHIFTNPPRLSVSERLADLRLSEDMPGARAEFHRRGPRVTMSAVEDGVVVASATPSFHGHVIHYMGHEWELDLERSRLGIQPQVRRGIVTSDGLGGAHIDVHHLHYTSAWQDHLRRHRAWLSGTVEADETLPSPVLAMGLRLTVGHWFHLRTGMWEEHRRAWDFAGF